MSAELRVRVGSVVIRLWESGTKSKGRVYRRWEFQDPITRARVKRATLEAARAEARRRAEVLLGLRREFSPVEAVEHGAAFTAAFVSGLSIRRNCEEMADYWAQARAAKVPEGEILEFIKAAVRERCTRVPAGGRVSLADAVKELLAMRKSDGVGEEHLRDLRLRLGRFAREVSCTLGELSASVMDDWLRGLKVGPRTRRNFRGALSNLISFAKGRRYLPAGFAELDAVASPRGEQPEVTVFSPEEMRWLLAGAARSVLPLVVIGGFAGLRQSEVLKLLWSHIDWDGNHIIVPAATKTGRRLAPLVPNLRAWLEPLRGEGRIVPISKHGVSKALSRTVAKATRLIEADERGLTVGWMRNGLRHSFLSYRCAMTRDLAAVADEAGHSVAMLKRHYRKVVTPAQAKAWFEIWPESMPNVMQMSLFGRGSATPQLLPNRQQAG